MLELGDLKKEIVIGVLRDWASKNEDVEEVYLYGSFARGNPNPNDLDVAIKSRLLPESTDPDTCLIAGASDWKIEIASLLRIEAALLHLYNTDYIGDEAIRVFP
jgi:predicted nucleotidyltransferase